MVISYEEAVKERQKAVTYSRQPNHAQPSRTVNQPSYETKYKNKGSSHAESIFDYNFSLPPMDFRQPNRNKDQTNPSYFPGKNKGKESLNIGGYQGVINPVFVSLNEEENQETLSRIPTPPPRDYFPSKDYGTTKYWYDTPPSTRQPIRRTTERYDSSLYDYGYTREPYNPPYETTRPTEDQQRYWEDYDLVTPPPYMEEEQLWEGYSKVVDDLLDRNYQRPSQEDRRYTNQYIVDVGDNNKYIGTSNKYIGDTNKYIGDTNKYIGDPQFVSTKPIIVGPGIAPEMLNPRQPSVDLLTSYSDRYGWAENPGRNKPSRKWTSIELAKPVWDEDNSKDRVRENYKEGSVEQVDIENVVSMDEKETFGNWDQSLNLIPALSRSEYSNNDCVLHLYSRSVQPKSRKWVLLAKTREVVGKEQIQDDEERRVSMTHLGIDVDGSKFS